MDLLQNGTDRVRFGSEAVKKSRSVSRFQALWFERDSHLHDGIHNLLPIDQQDRTRRFISKPHQPSNDGLCSRMKSRCFWKGSQTSTHDLLRTGVKICFSFFSFIYANFEY